jgi:hypothetical protein
VGSRSTNLPSIAGKVPGGAKHQGVKPESRVKRFERWLRNEAIDSKTFFLPFAEALLLSLCHVPLVLVIDGSIVGRGCMTLMISLVYKQRALPVVWTVAKRRKGHFPERIHVELMSKVRELVPPGSRVVVLGDLFVVPNASLTKREYGPVLAITWWRNDCKDPIHLVTNMTSAEEACSYYQRRFKIETLFSDQKSRGFHLNKSHLSNPSRVSRLMIATCLAYFWIIYLGAHAMEVG